LFYARRPKTFKQTELLLLLLLLYYVHGIIISYWLQFIVSHTAKRVHVKNINDLHKKENVKNTYGRGHFNNMLFNLCLIF